MLKRCLIYYTNSFLRLSPSSERSMFIKQAFYEITPSSLISLWSIKGRKNTLALSNAFFVITTNSESGECYQTLIFIIICTPEILKNICFQCQSRKKRNRILTKEQPVTFNFAYPGLLLLSLSQNSVSFFIFTNKYSLILLITYFK